MVIKYRKAVRGGTIRDQQIVQLQRAARSEDCFTVLKLVFPFCSELDRFCLKRSVEVQPIMPLIFLYSLLKRNERKMKKRRSTSLNALYVFFLLIFTSSVVQLPPSLILRDVCTSVKSGH